MENTQPLDERKQLILKAVVADYTATAVPVGSHALAAHLSNWSSATIRNELANLVDIGYLLQPHTSAGRVPSDKGYRYFVDFLMKEEGVPANVKRQLDPYFDALPSQLEGVLEVAAMVLALVTDSVAVVTGPRALSTRLKHLDLVSLDANSVLFMVVLEGNVVRQHTVKIVESIDQPTLTRIAALFNESLRGLNSVEMDAVATVGDGGVVELRDHLVAFLRSVDAHQDTVVVHDGMRNLLHQPEFEDTARLEQVLAVVEEERILSELLATMDHGEGQSLQIMIGRESGMTELSQCSLVLTTYDLRSGNTGTIGILGPTRMRYSQVAPRVRYVAQKVTEALERLLG